MCVVSGNIDGRLVLMAGIDGRYVIDDYIVSYRTTVAVNWNQMIDFIIGI